MRGLTRASIHKESLQEKMDCRVKPGNDNKKRQRDHATLARKASSAA
jgi:hypothetical protein